MVEQNGQFQKGPEKVNQIIKTQLKKVLKIIICLLNINLSKTFIFIII